MSRKISIATIKNIQWLVKEDTLIVVTKDNHQDNVLLSNFISTYQEGVIVLVSPEKKHPVHQCQQSTEKIEGNKDEKSTHQLKIKDKILFENSNILHLSVEDEPEKKYFVISKKDVLMVLK